MSPKHITAICEGPSSGVGTCRGRSKCIFIIIITSAECKIQNALAGSCTMRNASAKRAVLAHSARSYPQRCGNDADLCMKAKAYQSLPRSTYSNIFCSFRACTEPHLALAILHINNLLALLDCLSSPPSLLIFQIEPCLWTA